jgi:hypothetical protein
MPRTFPLRGCDRVMREQRFLDILGTSAGSNRYIFTFGGAVGRSPLFEEGNRCSPE